MSLLLEAPVHAAVSLTSPIPAPDQLRVCLLGHGRSLGLCGIWCDGGDAVRQESCSSGLDGPNGSVHEI